VDTKPSIVEVVSEYTHLRRAGKEYVGLCPFHDEKTPSFFVNEDKGVFNCFGCNEHGDVFDFLMKKLGLDFKGVLDHLGVDSGTIPKTKPRKSIERQAAEVITTWADEMSLKISARMREIGRRSQTARTALGIEETDKDLLREEIESWGRQWAILEVMDDDLANPQLLPALWQQREAVEEIVNE